jgi:hypothetical protein
VKTHQVVIRNSVALAVAISALGCGHAGSSAFAPATLKTSAVVAAAAKTGSVELHVAGYEGYHVQAKVSDVAQLRVTVTGAALSEPVLKLFSTAALAAGKGRITIPGLPPGTVSVKVEALSTSGVVLGQDSASIDVVAGKTALATVHIKLDPTINPAGAGDVAVNVNIEDGDESTAPIEAATPDPGHPDLGPATPTPPPTKVPPGGVVVIQPKGGQNPTSVTAACNGTGGRARQTSLGNWFWEPGLDPGWDCLIIVWPDGSTSTQNVQSDGSTMGGDTNGTPPGAAGTGELYFDYIYFYNWVTNRTEYAEKFYVVDAGYTVSHAWSRSLPSGGHFFLNHAINYGRGPGWAHFYTSIGDAMSLIDYGVMHFSTPEAAAKRPIPSDAVNVTGEMAFEEGPYNNGDPY